MNNPVRAERIIPSYDQILRFAVGAPDGPRSRPWRLWVPKAKSDVYISSRRLGSSVKVSLHEPGPSRFALTAEWVRRTGYQAPDGKDRRLACEWNRLRPRPPRQIARPFSIIVPWDEVRERPRAEKGDIVWVEPPGQDIGIHFDIIYVPAEAAGTGHPGQRSMGTTLVGSIDLHNGERVFVTALARPMSETLLDHITRLRKAHVRDADGKPLLKNGMLAFSTEPNPDAQDGTEVGVLLDITRDQ